MKYTRWSHIYLIKRQWLIDFLFNMVGGEPLILQSRMRWQGQATAAVPVLALTPPSSCRLLHLAAPFLEPQASTTPILPLHPSCATTPSPFFPPPCRSRPLPFLAAALEHRTQHSPVAAVLDPRCCYRTGLEPYSVPPRLQQGQNLPELEQR